MRGIPRVVQPTFSHSGVASLMSIEDVFELDGNRVIALVTRGLRAPRHENS